MESNNPWDLYWETSELKCREKQKELALTLQMEKSIFEIEKS